MGCPRESLNQRRTRKTFTSNSATATTLTKGQPPLGFGALHQIKAKEPPQWLAPSSELSRKAREASHCLFSFPKPFTPKSTFDHLLVDGFDAEQIWQQIDLQSQPLISLLRQDVKRLEKKEYRLKTTTKNPKKKKVKGCEEDDEEGDEEEEEDEDDELGEFGLGDDVNEDADKLEYSRYEDFFGGKKKKDVRRNSELIDGSEDSDTGDEQEDGEAFKSQKRGNLSTHEKELEKLRSKIDQMEEENLEQKTWTMQGEVTATKRPMNSGLEARLDFEHNMRPAPLVTEEVTASIEDLIQKRILEGRFDDVQKPPGLLSKSPRERKELDENKSKKGLAEIYEEEYAQKTNQDYAPLTFSDERKKEASMLFKNLCLKLDALSHFHFNPKPAIDDMSIQTNVPALAMEEIAPVAVSDAAMLAAEEVFTGKGDIKEDAEVTQAERKRRRANKKRKFKAETAKRAVVKKARESTPPNGKEAMS